MPRIIQPDELLARLCADNGIKYSDPNLKGMIAVDHLREEVKFNPDNAPLQGVNLAYERPRIITDQYGHVVKRTNTKDRKYRGPY